MFSKFAKVLLVGTAFAPILLTMAWIRFIEGPFLPFGAGYLVAAALITFLCWLLIKGAERHFEALPFTPTLVKTADPQIIAFVLAYLFPLVNTSGTTIRPENFWFVMAILAVVVWTTFSYHVNPILGVLGYHFYEVTDKGNVTYILITRRELRDTLEVAKVVTLTEYVVLEIDN